MNAAIDRHSHNPSDGYKLVAKHLQKLTDMQYVYNQSNTVEKREFVSMVFDSRSYYENGIYRTPTMMAAYLITI